MSSPERLRERRRSAQYRVDLDVDARLQTPSSTGKSSGYIRFGVEHGLRDDEVPVGYRLAGVTTGYRRGGTYAQCLLTLFTIHNQTLNSWTMILGWLMSCWLLLWALRELQPRGADLVAFVALWSCPTLHLPFTVGYHQFACMSPEALRYWRGLDVIFIFWASVPLTFALAYFVMPLPYALGLTAVALALALHAWHNAHSLPAGAEINKKANTRYVGLVVLVYTSPVVLQACKDLAGMLLSGAAGAYQLPYEVYDPLYSVKCAAALAFCFVYGGVTYVASFPDVYAPGMFDIVGAAQQLMHMAIVGAHALEWLFVIHMFHRRHGLPHP